MKVLMYDRVEGNGDSRLLKNSKSIADALNGAGVEIKTFDRSKTCSLGIGAEDILLDGIDNGLDVDTVIICSDSLGHDDVLTAAEMYMESKGSHMDRIFILGTTGLTITHVFHLMVAAVT